ncbi:hypothetical protein EBZ70_11995, partial [bacterium]|nr:hypothetical protein [bacterium]
MAVDEAVAGAEKARFLPRIGAFAQGDLTRGSRDTGTSYSAGAYLQWELFNATSLGAVSQGEREARSARQRADAVAEDVAIQDRQAREMLSALDRTLVLLDESLDLSEEQIKNARSLFQNGSINALQLTEVFARRADVIQARSDAEAQWVQ